MSDEHDEKTPPVTEELVDKPEEATEEANVEQNQPEKLAEEAKSEPVEKLAPEPKHDPLSRAATIRKWFFYILIGGLVVSAVISIIAVLVGEMNDIVTRSLWTTFIMVVHSLIAVALMSAASNERNTVADGVAINVLIGLTIASFITAVLGIWDVVANAVVGDLYTLFFYALLADVLIFALLHANFSDSGTAKSAKASIAITVAFFLYLIPSVFSNSLSYTLPDIYSRGVAAFSILLSTAVVITIIFQWVHAMKHRDIRAREQAAALARGEVTPAVPQAGAHTAMPSWLKVLLVILVVVFGLPILFAIIGVIVTIASLGR